MSRPAFTQMASAFTEYVEKASEWGRALVEWLGSRIGASEIPEAVSEIASADAGPFWMAIGLHFIFGAGLFWYSFDALRRARLIENTATSRVRSAAQGYVELVGHARMPPGCPELIAPLTRQPCCWWSYEIQAPGKHGKKTGPVRSLSPFLLVDDTGPCLIDPLGAEVSHIDTRWWRGDTPLPEFPPPEDPADDGSGGYLYQQTVIKVGDPLYAMGDFRSRSVHIDMAENEGVASLMKEWDEEIPHRVASEFFKQRITEAEQQKKLREAAHSQVRILKDMRMQIPDINVLFHPYDGRPLILSAHSQKGTARRYQVHSVVAMIASVPLLAYCGLLLYARALGQ